MNVLILCSANINRSPLIATIMKRKGFTVDSAGFRGSNRVASKKVREWTKQNLNMDLSEHKSKFTTQAQIDWADVVIFMRRKTYDNARSLGFICPLEKTIFLGDLLDPPRPQVPDPCYISPKDQRFDKVMTTIVEASNRLADYLRKKRATS